MRFKDTSTICVMLLLPMIKPKCWLLYLHIVWQKRKCDNSEKLFPTFYGCGAYNV